MAHADDMEYYVGGTIPKFVDQGYEAILLMLSNNMAGGKIKTDGGYLTNLPEDLMPVREAEMRAGAEILGVKTIETVGFKNGLYFTGEKVAWIGDPEYDVHHPAGREPMEAADLNQRCINLIQGYLEKYEPEIVVTHNFSSGFEHTASAHLVNQAFGQAAKAGAAVGSLWIPAHVRHCAWESDVRLFPSPNVLIDISDYWERKLAALRAHVSQRVEGTIANIETIDRYWGIARNCKYAEPFFTIHDARYK